MAVVTAGGSACNLAVLVKVMVVVVVVGGNGAVGVVVCGGTGEAALPRCLRKTCCPRSGQRAAEAISKGSGS